MDKKEQEKKSYEKPVLIKHAQLREVTLKSHPHKPKSEV